MSTEENLLSSELEALGSQFKAFRSNRPKQGFQYDESLKQQVINLMSKGVNPSEVSNVTGIAKSVVYRWKTSPHMKSLPKPKRLKVIAEKAMSNQPANLSEPRAKLTIGNFTVELPPSLLTQDLFRTLSEVSL